MKNKSFLIVIAVFFAIGIFINQIKAQDDELNLSLRAAQVKINRLAADQATDQAVFLIDQPTLISFEMITNNQNVQTSITTPSGIVLTPATVVNYGGEFLLVNGSASEITPLILTSLTGNYHYIYTFALQETGSYTVNFRAPIGLTTEVPIITEVSWDSPIVAKLVAAENEVSAVDSAVFTALLFNGNQPVTGANVEVSLKDQAGNKTLINLFDNGSGFDDRAGDGLYTAQFIPPAAGRYSAVAGITGNAGGIAFKRNSATRLIVHPASGKLSGTFADQGKDDDFDALIDRVSFTVGTQITTAGNYQALVHLKTAAGKQIVGSGIAQLPLGSGSITVDIPAESFLETGESGPYTVALVELQILDAISGARTVDYLRDLGQTGNYPIRQFQRKPLILTGVVSEQAFDDNGNGKFDRLRVAVEVDVLNAGFYRWNMKLSDQNLQKIDFVAGQGNLPAGLNQIALNFDGSIIGSSGANGPFLINDLLLFGSKSLVAAEVGETRPYLSGQFENGQSGDVTPPTLTVQLSPDTIFPPNHQMVPVTATISVSDDQDSNPSVRLISVESNEPESGNGNGDQPNDIQNVALATDDREFSVRAERFGNETGRIYTVTYEARDASGNSTTVTKQILVPHDRR